MNKLRLKRKVVPFIYVALIVTVFFGVAVVNNILLKPYTNYDYSKSIMKDVTENVLKEAEEDSNKFLIPFESQKVEPIVTYYDMNDENTKKENSLIYYENTYMPSSGIIYASDEDFDVLSVYDGKVTKISNDEILGTVVEVTHNTNLITYYYSLKDVPVNEGDEIKAGTILGRATTNKIYDNKNNFLFEVYYQGKSLNPEKFYQTKPNELQ